MIANTSSLYVVPEEIVKQCAQTMLDDETNNFKNFLNVAQEFRQAGLTPMYLCSENMKDLFVTSEENMRKKLH